MIIHCLSTSGLSQNMVLGALSLQHWLTQRIDHHFGQHGQKITDTLILSPPKDDWTSFTQPHHITLDISVTGWAYSQFPSCKASNFQAFSPDTFLHILSLGSCPVNSTGPQRTSLPSPWCSLGACSHGWDGTGQQFASHGTHSQVPEFPSGNTKQTRCPLKKKERNITRFSRKQKRKKE